MDESTINQCLRGKRTDNFTSDEKCVFIDLLVNKYKSLHEDRSHNKENNVLKRETWKSLLRDFHAGVGNSRRTLTQIKTLYENIKHRIKKCVDKGVFEIDWEPVNESGTFKIPIQLFEKIRTLYEQKTTTTTYLLDTSIETEVITDETAEIKDNLEVEQLEATTLEAYPNFAILKCNKAKDGASKPSNLRYETNDASSDSQSQEQDNPPTKRLKVDSCGDFSLPKDFLLTTEEFRRLAQIRAAAAQAELKLELEQNKQRHIAELRVLDLKAKAQQAKIEYYNVLKKRLLNETE